MKEKKTIRIYSIGKFYWKTPMENSVIKSNGVFSKDCHTVHVDKEPTFDPHINKETIVVPPSPYIVAILEFFTELYNIFKRGKNAR